MKAIASVAFFACLVVCSANVAEAGASQVPATQPAHLPVPKDESPREALLRGTKIFESLDVAAAMKLYECSGESETDWCRNACEYYVAVTRVELMVRAKWGQTADDSYVHALGEITEGDLKQARIIHNNDLATVMYPGDSGPPLVLEKIKGEWKIPVRRILATSSADDMKALNAAMKTIRDGMPKLAADIQSGKLGSADEVDAAAKKLADEAYPTVDSAKK